MQISAKLVTHRNILFILAVALFLRSYGLDRRMPNHDELHCRGDMSQMQGWLLNHGFRRHSVKHEFSRAPHGLVPQFTSFFIGKVFMVVLGPILPTHDFKRDNILSRFGNMLFSVAAVALVFRFAQSIFQGPVALSLAIFVALSPGQIIWGRSEFGDVVLAFFALLGFYAVWRAVRQENDQVPWVEALIAGACGAMALASKWSIIVLLPFYPLCYVLCRMVQIRQGQSAWRRRDTLFLVVWLLAFAGSSWLVLSLDSWQWAFSPPPGPYGDKKIEGGPLKMLEYGLLKTFRARWDILKAVATYWGGPLFFVTWLISLWAMIRRTLQWDLRAVFWSALLTGAIFYQLMSLADWFAWRSCFIVLVIILSAGFWLETLSARTLILWVGIVALATVPLSFYSGWRLGPALVPYHSSQFTFYDKLPDHPEYPVFPLRRNPLQHYIDKYWKGVKTPSEALPG